MHMSLLQQQEAREQERIDQQTGCSKTLEEALSEPVIPINADIHDDNLW